MTMSVCLSHVAPHDHPHEITRPCMQWPARALTKVGLVSSRLPVPELNYYYYTFRVDADTYREKGGVWPTGPTHVATHQATAVTG